MDIQLARKMQAFVKESLRVADSNPVEIADYLYASYKEAGKLDKLMRINWRLSHRLFGEWDV